MKIKIFFFAIFFLISSMAYNLYMLNYVDENTVITMDNLSKEQNNLLKSELNLNQFSSLTIMSVRHPTTWGNDTPRYFGFDVMISEKEKGDFLSYIEKSEDLGCIDHISDNEFEICYVDTAGSTVESYIRKEGIFSSFRGMYLNGLLIIILMNSIIFIPYKKIYSRFSIGEE